MSENEVRKPNIVFLFGDDWGKYASAYGKLDSTDLINKLIETPNFDRVAREGALLTNAYVTAPACTPCRSSILSGTYFWETGLGAILEGAEWDESIPSYPLMLEEKGYHIGYSYKVWSPGRSENAPYGGLRTRYEPAGNKWREFSQEVAKRVPELGIQGAKNVLFDEVRSNFLAFLDDVGHNQPFCYWWGPVNTHRAWKRGSGKDLWGLDPDKLKGSMPPFLPDVDAIREDFNDYLGEVQALDAGIGVIIDELEKIGQLDNTLLVVSGDHGVPGFPRAKCNLYDIGSQVAFAARWPGHIEEGQILNEFVNLMSLAPTFLEAGGVEPNKNMAESILPLLVGDTGVNSEGQYDFVVTGRERQIANSINGGLPYPSRAIRTKDFLYIRNFAPERWPMGDPNFLEDPKLVDPDRIRELTMFRAFLPPPHEKLVYGDLDPGPTKTWMLVHRNEESVKPNFDLCFGKRPAEELYDLNIDPWCMENVAGEDKYSEMLRNLSDKLVGVMRDHNDPRMVDDECRYESYPYAGPVDDDWYDISHNDAIWTKFDPL